MKPDGSSEDVAELHRGTGLTRQAIQAMAKRERWPFEATSTVAGRVKHWYPIDALPERLHWLVAYFRRNPGALRREGRAAYNALMARRALITPKPMRPSPD